MRRKPKWVLIVGATSGIARPLAREFAAHGYALLLAGRDQNELEAQAADLRVRAGVRGRSRVETIAFDAVDYEAHAAFWRDCLQKCDGELYGLILCHGLMPPQEALQRDLSLAQTMIEVNYSSYVALLNLAAEYYQAEYSGTRRRGFIAAIGSVAGDRGRAGNYLYGSTKAALDVLMQGLRQRLAAANIAVTTIKPGPIDTGMTFGLDKLPLLASPEQAAREIFRALRRRREVVYTPAPWRLIMLLLQLVPERVWKRLRI
jgi:short-subunit dehydrogenase